MSDEVRNVTNVIVWQDEKGGYHAWGIGAMSVETDYDMRAHLDTHRPGMRYVGFVCDDRDDRTEP